MSEAHNESLRGRIMNAELVIQEYKIKIQDAEEFIEKLKDELCPDT